MNNDKEVDNKLLSKNASEWQTLVEELEHSYAAGDIRRTGHLFYDFPGGY